MGAVAYLGAERIGPVGHRVLSLAVPVGDDRGEVGVGAKVIVSAGCAAPSRMAV